MQCLALRRDLSVRRHWGTISSVGFLNDSLTVMYLLGHICSTATVPRLSAAMQTKSAITPAIPVISCSSTGEYVISANSTASAVVQETQSRGSATIDQQLIEKTNSRAE